MELDFVFGSDSLYRRYRTFFECYFSRRFGDLQPLISSDVLMDNFAPANSAIAGARQGRDAFLAYLTSSGDASASYVFWRAEEWLRRRDTLVVMGREKYIIHSTGRSCETPFVHHTRWHKGQIAYWREFYDTAGMQAAYTPVDA